MRSSRPPGAKNNGDEGVREVAKQGRGREEVKANQHGTKPGLTKALPSALGNRTKENRWEGPPHFPRAYLLCVGLQHFVVHAPRAELP